MPALPSVPNVVKIVLEGNVNGQPYRGVTHWAYTTSSGSLTNVNAFHIAGQVADQWNAHMGPTSAADVSLDNVVCTDLTSPTAANANSVGTGPFHGGSGVEAISPSACVLEDKLIGRRYRGGHPRTYWPGPNVGDTDSSFGRQLTPGAHTTWDAAIQAYYPAVSNAVVTDSTCNCSSFGEVCVHYYSAAAGFPAPPAGHTYLPAPLVDPIGTRVTQFVLATQRRRLHRTG